MTCFGKHSKRIARAGDILLLEALLFAIQVGMAIIGAVLDSGVHRLLAAQGLVAGWGVTVGVIGVGGITLALGEWIYGLDWNVHQLRAAYFLRFWCSLCSIVAWAYLAHALYFFTDFNKALFPLVLAPIFIAFHACCCYVLRRESVILDPQKNTRNLESEIDRRRVST
jgi:hypothetical protein